VVRAEMGPHLSHGHIHNKCERGFSYRHPDDSDGGSVCRKPSMDKDNAWETGNENSFLGTVYKNNLESKRELINEVKKLMGE
jgi:hypothetical protein